MLRDRQDCKAVGAGAGRSPGWAPACTLASQYESLCTQPSSQPQPPGWCSGSVIEEQRGWVWSIETGNCLTPGPCPAPPNSCPCTACPPGCIGLWPVVSVSLLSQGGLCPGEGLWLTSSLGVSERNQVHSAVCQADLSHTALPST